MMNNPAIRNRKVGDNMFGDEEHQEIAREVLPLLIEKAKARETINYGDLAYKFEISPFGYPMSQMLGSIGTTLSELGETWQEDIPHITALVVKSGTGYPSFPPNTPNEVFDRVFERIYNYPKWDAVQKTLLSDDSPAETEETVQEGENAVLIKSIHKWKRIALAFALAFVITLTALVWPKSIGDVVFITRTGRKYHTYDCAFLEKYKIKDKFAILLDKAEKDYDPCGICNPRQ